MNMRIRKIYSEEVLYDDESTRVDTADIAVRDCGAGDTDSIAA